MTHHLRRLAIAGIAVLAGAAFLATVAAAMHFTAWGPVVVAEPAGTNSVNTAAHDGCPIESPDGLSLFIASNRDGYTGSTRNLDIWVATRASVDAPWGAPQNLGEPINTGADEFCPTPVRGNGLFFVSRKAGGCGLGDVYFTRRNPVHGWSEPQNLGCAPTGPNSDLDEQGPSYFETGAGAQLYFSRSRTAAQGGAVPGDIVASELSGGGFGPASAVAELNSTSNDIQPNVRKDGREVVFSSNRAGGQGSQDIWVSTRASTDDPWSAPVNLGTNVNSANSESRPSLSWDAKTLYLGITPPAGPPGDVYVTTREKANGK
ncbi:MAG TPA: hypothetical protein VNK94_11215 [Gaiellaceae bacterium]|jgi:hypothetical protein|nr:hypothetical protein [Gaiellaceae bacterium]